jgi:hypothetical protein
MPDKYHDALMARLDQIAGLGQNATRLTPAATAPGINMPGVDATHPDNPMPNYPTYEGTGPAPANPGGSFGNFINAIGGQESSGNYTARNKHTGAMGKYQIMPANIQGNRGWDYEALGRNISTAQFMASPQIQEQIARYKLKSYYDKYGAAGAAVAWYAGPGAVASYNRGGGNGSQGNYPSIRGYVNQILSRMG